MSHWRRLLDPESRGGRFLPWKEVARATGLSRTTAWRLQKRDEFPSPYAISPGRVGYREDEVEAWRISRDPSAARAKPTVASESPPAPVQRPPAEASPAPPDSEPVATSFEGPKARANPVTPDRGAAAKPARAGRRRSQHAAAIAQQMLFDF